MNRAKDRKRERERARDRERERERNRILRVLSERDRQLGIEICIRRWTEICGRGCRYIPIYMYVSIST